jgi:hypothetical protein
LAGENEVLGENLPQHHLCPSQNPTRPDPGLNPGRRSGKPATNRLNYGAAANLCFSNVWIILQKGFFFCYQTEIFKSIKLKLLFLLVYWGVESNWVHTALRTQMAYCANPGWLWWWRNWWSDWQGKPK